MAEDIAQVGVGLQHLPVEEGGDVYAMLSEDGNRGSDELALLRSKRRRVRQILAGLNDLGHGCGGMVCTEEPLPLNFADILYRAQRCNICKRDCIEGGERHGRT